MINTLTKRVVVFDRPFEMPDVNVTCPACEYSIETELALPPDYRDTGAWKASVMIYLVPRAFHPGIARSLLVSSVDFDKAQAKNKPTGKQLSDVLLDEMLADPMVQLVMQADRWSEIQLRHLNSQSKSAEVSCNPKRMRLKCVRLAGRLKTYQERVFACVTRPRSGATASASVFAVVAKCLPPSVWRCQKELVKGETFSSASQVRSIP